MQFRDIMLHLEKRSKAKRPGWKGYVYLDTDNILKYYGDKADESHDEIHWEMDFMSNDWELCGEVDMESGEITQARLESLMDASSCHIKRLYYLEELINEQYKAFQRIAENSNTEMDKTRKSLEKMEKSLPVIRKNMNKFSLIHDDYKELTAQVRNMNKRLDEFDQKLEKLDKRQDEREMRYKKAVGGLKKADDVTKNVTTVKKNVTSVKNTKENDEKKEMAAVKKKVDKILKKG